MLQKLDTPEPRFNHSDRACECEHAAHFDCEGQPQVGHDYWALFNRFTVSNVKTPYGTFAVCRTCRETCYSTYIRACDECGSTGRCHPNCSHVRGEQ